MHTLELTDDELTILRAALHSYLDDFGHEEADVLRRIKQLLAKLPPAEESDPPAEALPRVQELIGKQPEAGEELEVEE